MRFLYHALIGFALALSCGNASARDPIKLILAHGLEEIESPTQDPWESEKWLSKYRRDRPLHVRIEKGKLVLAHSTGKEQQRFPPRYETPSIRYVWTNNPRQYSSHLHAVFKDGKTRKLLVDVMSIVPRGPELLLFSGSRHMLNVGAIHRVASPDASPRVSLITLLPEAPVVVIEDPKYPDRKRLFIVGLSSLMSISQMGGGNLLEIHAWARLWAGGTPNSAEFYEDHLVIASSACVVVVKFEQGLVVSARYFAPKVHSPVLHSPPNSGPTGAKR